MRILLLSPPYLPEYMRNARCDFVSLSATQWYPVLLGYLGSHLQACGQQVKLVDAPAHYLDHEQTREVIRSFCPDLLVLYTGTKSEQNDIEFGDGIVAELGCDAVIVGPFASIDPRKTLARCRHIDKLVVGEFEHPVAELAAAQHLQEIANLCWKNGTEIIENPLRPPLTTEALDAIPFVSGFLYSQVDLLRYKTPSEYFPFMDIMTGRGCQWGICTYCLWPHTYTRGRHYSMRSISNVIEEFQFISRKMPEVKSVMIQDDTFVEERAREFCQAKLEVGNTLPWSCYVRADMSLDVLRLMKQAGCRNLHVGYESADPQVLKRIRKGVTVDQMTRFTNDAKKAGLRIHGDFAFGFPGETPEGAQKTIEWACQNRPHTAQFQLMIPFPGTPYYQEMAENGWLNADGQPDMPHFPNAQIRATAKRAYRAYYLSPAHFWQCCLHPYENVLSRLKTISRAIPAMFWQKWNV